MSSISTIQTRWRSRSVPGRLRGKEIRSPTCCRIRFDKRLIRLGFVFVSEATRREPVIDEMHQTSSHHNMVWSESASISPNIPLSLRWTDQRLTRKTSTFCVDLPVQYQR